MVRLAFMKPISLSTFKLGWCLGYLFFIALSQHWGGIRMRWIGLFFWEGIYELRQRRKAAEEGLKGVLVLKVSCKHKILD